MKHANKTIQMIIKLTRIIYIFGSPTFWVNDPEQSNNNYDYASIVIAVFSPVLIVSEWGSIITQANLSEKQLTDLVVFCFSHPIIYYYYLSMIYYRKRFKKLLSTLAIDLKDVYNDEALEKQMIKKATFYSFAFVVLCGSALALFGFNGILAVLSGGTFTTVITFWPDVEDRSTIANVARVFLYLAWWIFMTRVLTAFAMILSIITCLSYQFKNLQKYFLDLNNICETKHLTQLEKEINYEKGLIIGIKLHSRTLWCCKETIAISGVVTGGQILVNIGVVGLLMLQIAKSERTLMNILPIIATGSTMLVGTGFIMCTAGNVGTEREYWASGTLTHLKKHKLMFLFDALELSSAIYHSGWQNCKSATSMKRILPLVQVAMSQAQIPVDVKVMGFFSLSYESYIKIVKMSYSLFSVLY